MRRRADLRPLSLALTCLMGCAAVSGLEGRLDATRTLLTQAERSGARACAPRELAVGRAHVEFAERELDEGHLRRAEEHFTEADLNARAAQRMSPSDHCLPQAPAVGDRDGDGYLDPDDQCPDVPETWNAFQDEDGCPDDPDTDGDGLADSRDVCPIEPEDRDQYLDEDGCPDPDNDSDGIPDTADRCPIQAEVINQFEDTDGCPDEAPAAAVVTAEAITINQSIYFDTDRATIQARSNAILDLVVAALREHAEITRISIEGNADDTGDARHNLTLSRDRARAVMRYLHRAGISSRRMTAVGNGSTRPAMQGDTDEAHSRNRRVEFVIVSGGANAAAPAPEHGRRHRRH